jgi:hypothetical protein
MFPMHPIQPIGVTPPARPMFAASPLTGAPSSATFAEALVDALARAGRQPAPDSPAGHSPNGPLSPLDGP